MLFSTLLHVIKYEKQKKKLFLIKKKSYFINRDCLWASIDPDTFFILSFCRCHCTVTCMIIFIFCTKVNIIFKKIMFNIYFKFSYVLYFDHLMKNLQDEIDFVR
jgi:hypothetical protein